MHVICRSISELKDSSIIERLEDKYDIDFSNEMMAFFEKNNGGIPLKKEIEVDGEEYEVRCFLSFNDDEYNSIRKPLETFQQQTKGKIVPIAKDSGDNYFCINIENGCIYYWDNEEDLYNKLADSFETFIGYLK